MFFVGFTAIFALLLSRRPSNIFRLVVTVVIDSVYAVKRCRPWSKSFVEFWKILKSEFNPSTAIAGIVFPVWVAAAFLRISVKLVFREAAEAVYTASPLFSQATAGKRISRQQINTKRSGTLATLTLYEIGSLMSVHVRKPKNR